MTPEKTLKREVATVMLLGFFGALFFHPEGREIAEIIKWPVFLFAGGAFGIDALAKQVWK